MASLADLIGKPPPGDIQLLQADVISVAADSATIRFGGSDTAENISGVRFLDGAGLAAADSVWVLRRGGSLIILGKLTPTSGTATTPNTVVGNRLYVGTSTPYGSAAGEVTPTNRAYTAAGNYALLADATNTFLNAPTGGNLYLRINNATIAQIKAAANQFTVTGSIEATSAVYSSNWFRSIGGTGWYSEDYGGGWRMTDSTYMRCYQDKIIYTNNEIRGSDGAIMRWNNTAGHGLATYGGLNSAGFMTRNDGALWCMCTGTMSWRMNGSDIMTLVNSGGYADLRANLYTPGTGNTVVIGASSNQLQKASSSKRWKDEISSIAADTNVNPVFSMRPLRYRWKAEHAAKNPELAVANAVYSKGIAGFFAEELAAVAPDTVHYDDKGNPTGIKEWSMFAYIVAAIQHCHAGLARRVAREDALEARIKANEARLAAIEAVPMVAAAIKKL